MKSILEKDELAMNLLIKEIKDHRKSGILSSVRQAPIPNQPGSVEMPGTSQPGSVSPNTSANQTQIQREKETEKIKVSDPLQKNKQMSELLLNRGNFASVLDSMELFYEDYSDPNHCIFVYRIFKKGLYKEILSIEYRGLP